MFAKLKFSKTFEVQNVLPESFISGLLFFPWGPSASEVFQYQDGLSHTDPSNSDKFFPFTFVGTALLFKCRQKLFRSRSGYDWSRRKWYNHRLLWTGKVTILVYIFLQFLVFSLQGYLIDAIFLKSTNGLMLTQIKRVCLWKWLTTCHCYTSSLHSLPVSWQ